MGNITNPVLAEFISRRISEILDITSLTFSGLANFSEISEAGLLRNYKKRSTISVETVAKLCDALSIELTLFFNTATKLTIDTGPNSRVYLFKTKFLPLNKSFFIDETATKNDAASSLSIGHRYQREIIAQLVFDSDYFLEHRTLEQIIELLKKDHQLSLKPERVTLLLRRYVAQEYLERKALPRDFSRFRHFSYCRTNKKQKIKSQDEITIIELTNILHR